MSSVPTANFQFAECSRNLLRFATHYCSALDFYLSDLVIYSSLFRARFTPVNQGVNCLTGIVRREVTVQWDLQRECW
jgi:hypothetical protein